MTTSRIYTDPAELAMLIDEFNFMTQGRTFASDAERDAAIDDYLQEYELTGEWLA